MSKIILDLKKIIIKYLDIKSFLNYKEFDKRLDLKTYLKLTNKDIRKHMNIYLAIEKGYLEIVEYYYENVFGLDVFKNIHYELDISNGKYCTYKVFYHNISSNMCIRIYAKYNIYFALMVSVIFNQKNIQKYFLEKYSDKLFIQKYIKKFNVEYSQYISNCYSTL